MSTSTDTLDRLTRDLTRYLQHESAKYGGDLRSVVRGMTGADFLTLADQALAEATGGTLDGERDRNIERWGAETYGAACDFVAWWQAEEEADEEAAD